MVISLLICLSGILVCVYSLSVMSASTHPIRLNNFTTQLHIKVCYDYTTLCSACSCLQSNGLIRFSAEYHTLKVCEYVSVLQIFIFTVYTCFTCIQYFQADFAECCLTIYGIR